MKFNFLFLASIIAMSSSLSAMDQYPQINLADVFVAVAHEDDVDLPQDGAVAQENPADLPEDGFVTPENQIMHGPPNTPPPFASPQSDSDDEDSDDESLNNETVSYGSPDALNSSDGSFSS